jgi:3-hydroxyacyl-[acyl-carrier-protein] dehydratase
VKFRKTVHPGDQLVIKVALVKARSKTGKVHGEAYVGNDLVAEADLMFSLVDA